MDGEIPDGGLDVFIDTGVPFGLFDFADANGVELNNIDPLGLPDSDFSGITLTLLDNESSITLPVAEDGVSEGDETVVINLVDGDGYSVDPNTTSVTLTISDPALPGGTAAGGLGDDIILGSDRDDILRGDLNTRDTQDDIAGGNDIIFGGGGNDRIGGKAGNDILSGDAGDDTIWGDAGDDILMGVTGNDILIGDNFSGGSGSDTFVFGNGDGTDTILDFQIGIDQIGLVQGELLFADLTITQSGDDALLGVSSSGETLAILENVQASALGSDSFVIVPDVSDPTQAAGLI